MDNPRLRVAVLIRHYNPYGGGAERYAVELTKQLASIHDVHLFAQQI
ncbi:MAG: glycosyltransferase family 1 protein, partial [Gammaproteobacteria bacterium]|nr:glycosyltransferase family 1 protein [Gammaproteobacteria bacterium]